MGLSYDCATIYEFLTDEMKQENINWIMIIIMIQNGVVGWSAMILLFIQTRNTSKMETLHYSDNYSGMAVV